MRSVQLFILSFFPRHPPLRSPIGGALCSRQQGVFSFTRRSDARGTRRLAATDPCGGKGSNRQAPRSANAALLRDGRGRSARRSLSFAAGTPLALVVHFEFKCTVLVQKFPPYRKRSGSLMPPPPLTQKVEKKVGSVRGSHHVFSEATFMEIVTFGGKDSRILTHIIFTVSKFPTQKTEEESFFFSVIEDFGRWIF